jgi:hypothetical protein
LFFYEGGLAVGVEKRTSPLRFAPVEMTAVFVGLSAWLKEVVEVRLWAEQEKKQILRLRRRVTTKKQKLDAKAMTKAKAKTRQRQIAGSFASLGMTRVKALKCYWKKASRVKRKSQRIPMACQYQATPSTRI